MIEAQQFLHAAAKIGFNRYTGVPCSFQSALINYVIDDPGLNFKVASNEGDAVAYAAGAVLGGQSSVVMMQNSGLGNAVNPLTSLTYTFRLPMLLIISLRGEPGVKDEPQHQLMGSITSALLEQMEIPWAYFPTQTQQIEPALAQAQQYINQRQRPYAFIMRKGSVAKYSLKSATSQNKQQLRSPLNTLPSSPVTITRQQALQKIIQLTPLEKWVVIATTGYTGRELAALADRANHFYMVGSMGCASAIGLGLADARPDLQVMIIDGDGAALMRMGNFASLGAFAGNNLTHVLLDNQIHESTGGQATVSAHIAFSEIAYACGYAAVSAGSDLVLLEQILAKANGPRFCHLKTKAGVPNDLPRPEKTPEQVALRLIKHIRAC